ncbi:hypothetical protein AB0B28_02345 [Glycomyces sp. NPDC046736]|uniref:hypothetical protein n=1 Tax=Glycomyces sp. NPDC046736 TaxID=3155615 RepID=UPI00340A0F31
MRTADLPELLRGLGVGSAWYAVGVPHEGSWCIQDMGSWWAVFFLERGTWGDIAKFGSEDQACRYLLGRFTELADAGTPGLGRDRKTHSERIEMRD